MLLLLIWHAEEESEPFWSLTSCCFCNPHTRWRIKAINQSINHWCETCTNEHLNKQKKKPQHLPAKKSHTLCLWYSERKKKNPNCIIMISILAPQTLDCLRVSRYDITFSRPRWWAVALFFCVLAICIQLQLLVSSLPLSLLSLSPSQPSLLIPSTTSRKEKQKQQQ